MPAVAFNAAVQGVASGALGTLTTSSLTIGAGSSIELVLAITFNAAVSAVVANWNTSETMTLVGGPSTSTNCGRTYFFHRTAPTTGAHTAVITWTTTSDAFYSLVAFNNAAGGVGNYTSTPGSSATASVTATNTANDALLAFFQNIHSFSFNNVTVGTEILNDASTNINGSAAYFITPGANQVWTDALTASDNWQATVATILNVVAASGTPYNPWPQWAPVLAQ